MAEGNRHHNAFAKREFNEMACRRWNEIGRLAPGFQGAGRPVLTTRRPCFGSSEDKGSRPALCPKGA
jgi:hypothetical protein